LEPKPKLNKCMNFYRTFKYGESRPVYARILLKLKLTFILLTTVILQVSATGYAQITLKEKDAPLGQIIQKIRRQTGYDFFYNAGMLLKAKPVTLNVTNATVPEVLDLCFKDQSFTYRIEQKTIVIQYVEPRMLQTRAMVVSGRVLDETDRPIPGASITIKNGRAGNTVSNGNGEFKIIVPSDKSILLFSYVGYKTQEIKLKPDQGPLLIRMEIAENNMKDVVITGTGITRNRILSPVLRPLFPANS
jgi:hypothetical protein